MMNRNLLIYGSFLIFSIFLVTILFLRIPSGHFLFIGDQFFRFTEEEIAANAFHLRKMSNFGVFNAWQLTVQTPDILFYTIIYKLGFTLIQAEKILFTLITFITLSLSYIGFNKLSKFYNSNIDLKVILTVTAWYAINPYLMVLWHGAVYNFGSSLTYSLAPLIIYYFHQSIINFETRKYRIICALLLFVASFTFWMLAALGIFLFLYTLALMILYRNAIIQILLNTGKLLLLYIPMVAMVIYPILHELSNNSADINGTFYPTFGEIKGGLLYQLLMWFSWGIYNDWTPRSIYPKAITDFYLSPIYIGATAALYGLLGFLIHKELKLNEFRKKVFIKRNYLAATFITIFFISIFLAKGQEPPFGGIFMFLYENVSFFKVFRSSDHRFGFPAVLALSLALLALTKNLKNTKGFVITLSIITIIQNFVFFTGELLIGQNYENKYFDRIVKIPDAYSEVAEYLNSQEGTFYVLPNPSIEYGTFNYDVYDTHIGQDMLPKLIYKPFADVPVISGMSIQSGTILYTSVVQNTPELLGLLPVKYVLQRKDIKCTDCPQFTEEKVQEFASEEYQNNLFTLYKIENPTSILSANQKVNYKIINPTRFEIELTEITDAIDISFMQSYSNNWNLYALPYEKMDCQNSTQVNETTTECTSEMSNINLSDLNINTNPQIGARTFPENLTHMNSWNITPEDISKSLSQEYYAVNSDGSYNLKLAIFYTPQGSYIFAIYVSVISVILSLIVLFTPALLTKKIFK